MKERLSMLNWFSKTIAVSTVLILGATAAVAQQPAAHGRIDFALGYSGSYSNLSSGSHQFWSNGGSAELSAQAWRGLGVSLNVTGLHTANTGAGVPLNLLTTTVGPRYVWMLHPESAHSLSFFGEGLIGEAHGFGSLFPDLSGPMSDYLSFAVQAGGGVDVGLSRHLSLRAVQANWLRTQMPNATTNVQNNLTLGAGIVFHTAPR